MFRTLAGVELYAVAQGASVVLFFLLAYRYLQGKRRLLHAGALTLFYMLANFVAAKFFFDLRQDPQAVRLVNYFRPQHYFDGGFWGWPVAFLPVVLAYPILFRLNRLAVYRAVALTVPLVIFMQKLGCLAIGCCAGRPSDVPWAIVFPVGSQCDTPGVPVHPVQLYDMLFALASYGVLRWMDRRPAARAFLFPAFIALYGINRVATEFFRPEFTGDLSTRQWLAGGAASLVLLMLLLGRRIWTRFVAEGRSGVLPLSQDRASQNQQ